MANDENEKQPLLSGTEEQPISNPMQRRKSRPSSYSELSNMRFQQKLGGFKWLRSLESLLEKQKLSFKQVFTVLSIYLGVGTLCFYLIREEIEGKKTNGILDSIYFCVVTMTTVGYGDLVPRSNLAKILASIYVFTGMLTGGLILSKGADYLVEKQQVLLVKAMHAKEKFDTDELIEEIETHKNKYKFLCAAALLLFLVLLGTVFLVVVEELAFVDAFYCVCCTITTLGYGDESFSTRSGRIFAIFWILSSTICLAQFLLYLAELYTEKRQKSIVKWVMTRKLTPSDLEDADLNHDKAVTASEFVVYTLKQMGKINQKDITMAMDRFMKLDADHNGSLTESDLLTCPSPSNVVGSD